MPEKGQKNRQRIIDAARGLFYRQGYHYTSFTEIADAAGVPRGNFYYYFTSKDDILCAVVEDRLARIRAMLAEWDKACPVTKERLRRFVAILIHEADDTARWGCPVGSLNLELAKSRPKMQPKAKELFDAFLQWLTRQFDALGHGEQASVLALHLLARAQGIVLIANAYSDPEFLRREAEQLQGWVNAL